MNRFLRALGFAVLALPLLFGQEAGRPAAAQAPHRPSPSTPQPEIVFSVSPDQALAYPPSIHYLPDEHSTILPAQASYKAMPGQMGPHNFFVAMANQVGKKMFDGAFVLQSYDFRHFFFAPGFGNPARGRAVFWAPTQAPATAAITP